MAVGDESARVAGAPGERDLLMNADIDRDGWPSRSIRPERTERRPEARFQGNRYGPLSAAWPVARRFPSLGRRANPTAIQSASLARFSRMKAAPTD